MNWNPKDWWAKAKAFLAEVKTEWGKMSFPSRDEVVGTTVVVLVVSVIFAIYLWIVDFGVAAGFKWMVEKVGS